MSERAPSTPQTPERPTDRTDTGQERRERTQEKAKEKKTREGLQMTQLKTWAESIDRHSTSDGVIGTIRENLPKIDTRVMLQAEAEARKDNKGILGVLFTKKKGVGPDGKAKFENIKLQESFKPGDEIEVNFTANGSQEANRTIGAGDILPPSVRYIVVRDRQGNERTGVRLTGMRGTRITRTGYYDTAGSYIPIYDGYTIKIPSETVVPDFQKSVAEAPRTQHSTYFSDLIQHDYQGQLPSFTVDTDHSRLQRYADAEDKVRQDRIQSLESFEQNKEQYDGLMQGEVTLTLTPRQNMDLNQVVEKAARPANKERYMRVSERTNVPWELIAAIHYREASMNFDTYLHNGDPLGRPTTHVPAGKYYTDWEEAAIDALTNGRSLGGTDFRSMMDYAEGFNGYGYRMRGLTSPYIWSGTNKQMDGKYVADGVFDPRARDQQLGIAPIVMALRSKQQETMERPQTPEVGVDPDVASGKKKVELPVGQEIAYVGDSLTVGYAYNNQEIPYKAHGGKSVMTMWQEFDEVLKQKPKTIVLLGGTNDLYGEKNASEVFGYIRLMADKAKVQGINVFVGTVPPMAQIYFDNNDRPARGKEVNEQIRRMNDMIRTAYPSQVVDFASALADGNNRSEPNAALIPQPPHGDGVHPGSAGYNVMRSLVADKLSQL